MPKFKNVSGETRYLGRPDGSRVGDGEVTEVDGSVKELDDAYLVAGAAFARHALSLYGRDDLSDEQQAELDAAHGELRLFPKSTWTLVKTAKGSES